jgi:hypothetical protein
MHAISSIFSAIYMLTQLLTWLPFVLLLQCCVCRSCPTNYSVEREHTALHASVTQLRADVATVQSAAAAQQRAELLAAAAAAAAASSSTSSTSASTSSSGQRLSPAAATLATAQLITLKLGAIALVQQAEVDGRTLPRTAEGLPVFLPGNDHTCNAYAQPLEISHHDQYSKLCHSAAPTDGQHQCKTTVIPLLATLHISYTVIALICFAHVHCHC